MLEFLGWFMVCISIAYLWLNHMDMVSAHKNVNFINMVVHSILWSAICAGGLTILFNFPKVG